MTNPLDVYTPENAIKWNSNGGADSDARPWVVNRVAELGRQGKTTLLDIGSGTGRWTKQFAQHMDLVLGIDCTREMVRIAKKTNPAPNVKYAHGNFLNSKLNGCDIVTALASLHYFKSREELNQVYEQIRETLNPNGHFIFYAPHPVSQYAGGTKIWRTEFAPGVSYEENFPFSSYIAMEDGTTRRGSGYHHQLAEFTTDLLKHGFKILDMKEFFARDDKLPHALVVDAKVGRKR
jgi:SAM-dependent methyltransferase